jgi:hypothetical protein
MRLAVNAARAIRPSPKCLLETLGGRMGWCLASWGL